MQEIGIYDAKTNLGQLVKRARAGEEILITVRGEPAARLMPPEQNFDRQDALNAIAEIRELRRGLTLGGIKIKDLISEGRM